MSFGIDDSPSAEHLELVGLHKAVVTSHTYPLMQSALDAHRFLQTLSPHANGAHDFDVPDSHVPDPSQCDESVETLSMQVAGAHSVSTLFLNAEHLMGSMPSQTAARQTLPPPVEQGVRPP